MKTRMVRQALALGLVALWLAAPAAQAQYVQDWVSKYTGQFSATDWITDMVVRDGYVYVTGREAQFTSYYTTIKYDQDGQEQWVRRYEAGQSQSAEALLVDAAGNVYVTGYQKKLNDGIDVVTLKYGPDGERLWARHYDNGSHDTPNDMEFDAAGNLYIAGASWVTAQQDFDMLLLKYDSDGNLLWDRTLDNGDGQLDTAYSLAVDPDGNAIMAGFTEPNAYLAKYSPSGELLWDSEKVGFSTNDDWRRVETDAAGNIFVLGEISPPGEPNYLWTSKYSPEGVIQWEQLYTGTANEFCYAGNLTMMPDGGVVITGQSWDLPFNINIVTIRYSKHGAKLWERLENAGYKHASGDDVAVDAEGRIYVTGYGYDFSYQEDIITLGYSPDGELLWTTTYSSPNPLHSDYPQAIALDEDLNVYVAAHSWTGNGDDYTTIKYSPGNLGIDASSLSAADGGTVEFLLDAGTEHALRNYVLLGSISGSSPGFLLPGGTNLPLNWDGFTTLTLELANTAFLVDSLGALDDAGQAAAQLNMPGGLPASAIGVELSFAFTLYAPYGFVSNARDISIVD